MYKYIFSLSFLLVYLVGFTTLGQAQISVSSNGNASFGNNVTIDNNATISGNSTVMGTVKIGTTSGDWTQPRLYVRTTQGSTYYNTGIKSYASGSAWNLYGVYGIADDADGGGGNHHRGLLGVASGGSSSNYGVYGSASGTGSWAGYFNGNAYATGSFQDSDERLKKDIESLHGTGVLAQLMQVDPKRYQFRDNEELRNNGLPFRYAKAGDHFGVIAQELENVFPELVAEVQHVLGEETGEIGEDPQIVTTKAVNYTELTLLLLAAVQELQVEVEALKTQLNEER